MDEATKKDIAREIGIIRKVDEKIHYTNIQQVVAVYNMLCEKNSLGTAIGKRYLASLESIILGESSRQCIICGAESGQNSVFCSSCQNRMSNGGKTSVTAPKTVSTDSNREEVNEKQRTVIPDNDHKSPQQSNDSSTFFANEYYQKQTGTQNSTTKQGFDEEFVDDEVRKNNSLRRKVIFFLVPAGLFFVMIGAALISDENDRGIAIFAIASGIICILWGIIWYIHERIRQSRGAKYVPYKGYFFYRMSSAERLKFAKRLRIFKNILSIVLVLLLISEGQYSGLLSLGSCFLMATAAISTLTTRIKHHVEIDDATYFELEELGLISDGDVVISLYKDFESWTTIKPNSKVLVLCQDNLSVLSFSDTEHARKAIIPLNGIDRFRIASGSATKVTVKKQTRKGEKNEEVANGLAGMIITIGFNGNCVKFYLRGESYMDSPEEFLSLFLKELDKRLTRKKKENLSRPARTIPIEDAISAESNEVIRNITITEEEIDTGISGYEDNDAPRRNISF